jgi:hypothetical protein
MTNFLTKITGNHNQKTDEPKQIGSSIRVIGDRLSGKTTYMAALARWPNADPQNSVIQSVTALGTEGEELINQAKNILEQGDHFQRTALIPDIYEVKDYRINIILKEKYLFNQKLLQLNLSCKDYTGEFFSDLVYKTGNSLLNDYMEDCIEANGLLLLIDGLSKKLDIQYANGLEKFLRQLDQFRNDENPRKIAFVITKCEQPELFVNRQNPQVIAKRFKNMMEVLNQWQKLGGGEVQYFATSAFGMLGTAYPEPNMTKVNRRDAGLTAVLKNPKRWKPFGLVAPIYWLTTGNYKINLDEE